MKSAQTALAVFASFAAGFLSQDDGKKEIETLEKRVAALEKYAQAQAKAAEALVKALDDSDAQGFTYGINPGSRKALLAGLKSSATAAQQNVPGAQPAAEKK